MAGHIQRRRGKANEWVARWNLPNGEQRSRSFTAKAEAETFLAEQTVARSRGYSVDPRDGRTTFGEWAEVWSAGRVHLRASTRARDESYLRSMILPTFADAPLSTIKRSDLRAWVSEIHASGRKAGTTRKAFQLTAAILKAAAVEGLIGHAPVEGIDLPADDRDEIEVITPEQIERLADEMDERYRALVLVTAYTGLRWGEIAALEISDVDFLRRSLTVRRTLVEVSGRITTNPPKTRAGRRSVALPGRIVDLLGEQVAGHSDGRVFNSPSGAPLRRSTWRRRFWIPATVAAGLDGLHFHTLRHTHASILIASGTDIQTIASRLGHSSPKVTLSTYSHLMPGRDQAAADALDAVLAEAEKGQSRAGPPDNVVSIGL